MRVARLKETYPTAKAELCGAETSIVWASQADHPQGVEPHRSEADGRSPSALRVDLHLYAFARPKSGEVHWLILPTVNAEVFSMALEHFAREVGAGKRKRILCS